LSSSLAGSIAALNAGRLGHIVIIIGWIDRRTEYREVGAGWHCAQKLNYVLSPMEMQPRSSTSHISRIQQAGWQAMKTWV
jgi:hypothetical protein